MPARRASKRAQVVDVASAGIPAQDQLVGLASGACEQELRRGGSGVRGWGP
jgi:hypothetical protein